jgi:hypothetical protein
LELDARFVKWLIRSRKHSGWRLVSHLDNYILQFEEADKAIKVDRA